MERLTGPDPARSTASWDDVVRELRRAPPAPERVGRHRGDRRRSGRWGRAVVVLVVLLLVAAWAVRRQGGDEPSPAAMASAAAPVAAESWTDVLAGLDAARIRAWETVSAAALRDVDVPGSSAARADRAVVGALRRDSLRPHGMRIELDTVGVIEKQSNRVRLRVVDRRSSYLLRDARDTVVRRIPARAARAWEVTLVRNGGRWLQASAVATRR